MESLYSNAPVYEGHQLVSRHRKSSGVCRVLNAVEAVMVDSSAY